MAVAQRVPARLHARVDHARIGIASGPFSVIDGGTSSRVVASTMGQMPTRRPYSNTEDSGISGSLVFPAAPEATPQIDRILSAPR
jgi:hypothetical protein